MADLEPARVDGDVVDGIILQVLPWSAEATIDCYRHLHPTKSNRIVEIDGNAPVAVWMPQWTAALSELRADGFVQISAHGKPGCSQLGRDILTDEALERGATLDSMVEDDWEKRYDIDVRDLARTIEDHYPHPLVFVELLVCNGATPGQREDGTWAPSAMEVLHEALQGQRVTGIVTSAIGLISSEMDRPGLIQFERREDHTTACNMVMLARPDQSAVIPQDMLGLYDLAAERRYSVTFTDAISDYKRRCTQALYDLEMNKYEAEDRGDIVRIADDLIPVPAAMFYR